jgi:hypothetical protein
MALPMTSSEDGATNHGSLSCPGMNDAAMALPRLVLFECIALSEPLHESTRASGDSRDAMGDGLRGVAGFESAPGWHCRRRFPAHLPGLLFLNTILAFTVLSPHALYERKASIRSKNSRNRHFSSTTFIKTQKHFS